MWVMSALGETENRRRRPLLRAVKSRRQRSFRSSGAGGTPGSVRAAGRSLHITAKNARAAVHLLGRLAELQSSWVHYRRGFHAPPAQARPRDGRSSTRFRDACAGKRDFLFRVRTAVAYVTEAHDDARSLATLKLELMAAARRVNVLLTIPLRASRSSPLYATTGCGPDYRCACCSSRPVIFLSARPTPASERLHSEVKRSPRVSGAFVAMLGAIICCQKRAGWRFFSLDDVAGLSINQLKNMNGVLLRF